MHGNRLGTIRIDENGQEMKLKGSISDRDFEELKKHSLNLFKHNSQQELHSMFVINFLEFNDLFKHSIQRLIRKYRNLLSDNPAELKFISRNANRLFLNFLSSARTYLDHTEAYLKRKYGKDSNEALNFKTKTNELFDNSFEYRFMYKLRNYAQHCGLPISNITFSINDGNADTEQINRTITLNPTFNKNSLLENYQEWGSKLKEDFKTLPEEFSTISVLRKYYKDIERLNSLFFSLERSSLIESIEYLEKFINSFENPLDEKTQLCVFYDFKLDTPNSYENSRFQIFKIQTELIEDINQKL